MDNYFRVRQKLSNTDNTLKATSSPIHNNPAALFIASLIKTAVCGSVCQQDIAEFVRKTVFTSLTKNNRANIVFLKSQQ